MTMNASRIAANVAAVRRELADACSASGRDPTTVTLVAVTKSQEPAVLPALRAAGITDFGENRVDHLQQMRLAAERGDRWHYIGRVQGRQLPQVASSAHVLHSLCDPGHVDRLAKTCQAGGLKFPVYLQVNTSGEAAKAGLSVEGLSAAVEHVRRHACLDLIGLMTMAPDLDGHSAASEARTCFRRLAEAAKAHGLPGLSMGMSGDFAIAIEEGATIIRVGSRLFA